MVLRLSRKQKVLGSIPSVAFLTHLFLFVVFNEDALFLFFGFTSGHLWSCVTSAPVRSSLQLQLKNEVYSVPGCSPTIDIWNYYQHRTLLHGFLNDLMKDTEVRFRNQFRGVFTYGVMTIVFECQGVHHSFTSINRW